MNISFSYSVSHSVPVLDMCIGTFLFPRKHRCYVFHNVQRSNVDTKFAEQYLERVYTALHAANEDHVYLELIRLLNDFGDKEKTADSVPQVWIYSSLRHRLSLLMNVVLCIVFFIQGDHSSWKVMAFSKTIFQAWKVMENDDDVLEFFVKMHYNFCFCKYHPVCSFTGFTY